MCYSLMLMLIGDLIFQFTCVFVCLLQVKKWMQQNNKVADALLVDSRASDVALSRRSGGRTGKRIQVLACHIVIIAVMI